MFKNAIALAVSMSALVCGCSARGEQAVPEPTGASRQAATVDTLSLSAEEVDRAVYTAIATERQDPEFDVAVGAAYHMLVAHPELGAADIRDAINHLVSEAQAAAPDHALDLSPDDSLYLGRILTALVAGAGDGPTGDGVRGFARAFLDRYRLDVDSVRQVASIRAQFDRAGQIRTLRDEMWSGLHQLARANPEVAAGVDSSILASWMIKTSHTAGQMLLLHAPEGVADFVWPRLQPDGSLAATHADVVDLVDAALDEGLSLSEEYADALYQLDAAEQAARDAVGLEPAPPPPPQPPLLSPLAAAAKPDPCIKDVEGKKSNLVLAIEKACRKQSDLADRLNDANSLLGHVFRFSAFLARHSNDPDFATDIELVGKAVSTTLGGIVNYSKSALDTAEKLAGLLGVGKTGFKVLGALALTGASVAVVFDLYQLFTASPKVAIEAKILNQVKRTHELLVTMRAEMGRRFDRIDKQLDRLYDEMMLQFAEVDFELGQIGGDVNELQESLYRLYTDLHQLERNIHELIAAQDSTQLKGRMDQYLNYFERTNQQLSYDDYVDGESAFYSWAMIASTDAIRAGTEGRGFDDDSLFTELSFPLAYNVNYLRELPLARFGLPPLATGRLPNPLDWLTGAEAYAQLAEEWPAHAQEIGAYRIAELIDRGERAGDALGAIADPALMAAATDHYRDRFAELEAAIAGYEDELEHDPAYGMYGADLWGGPDQEPDRHRFQRRGDLPRCDGQSYGAGLGDTLDANIPAWDHADLMALAMADNLGAMRVDACVSGHWEWTKATPSPWGSYWTFTLLIDIEHRAGRETVHRRRFRTIKHSKLVRPTDIDFDPDATWDPYYIVASLDNGVWAKLNAGAYTSTVSLDSGRLDAVRDVVSAHLGQLQRAFYGGVADRAVQAGDPIGVAAERLSGSRLMLAALAGAGLPLSLEANDALRALLHGSDAIFAGFDGAVDDDALDDVADVYRYFSIRAEPPPASNIAGELADLAGSRIDALAAELDAVANEIQITGEFEPPELLAPTVMRLSLIEARVP